MIRYYQIIITYVISIADMAKAKNKELLYAIGERASSVIKKEHFGEFY